jgi:hypothetical protein
MAFLCVSQQGEFENTIEKKIGEIYVENFLPKKLREKKILSFSLSDNFLSRFWPFLCLTKSKTPLTHF